MSIAIERFVGAVRSAAVVAVAALLSSCSGDSVGSGHQPESTDSSRFPIPTRIAVSVAPFASIEDALRAEAGVDWLHDKASANSVTLAYAATELRDHLVRAGVATSVTTAGSMASPAIVLALHQPGVSDAASAASMEVDYGALGDQGYAIVPFDGSVYITANTRVGLLYGAYALLDQLGFAWYDPYETYVPDPSALRGSLQWHKVQAAPLIQLRGFWVYAHPPVPDEFAVWLARNRLNLGGRARPALQKKLGMRGWGGHHDLLQQEFSRAGIFEQHPDWFALIDGVRRPVTTTIPDVYFNPAFGNPAVAEYFAERIIERLESGDLKDVDVLNVWPADDRFNLFDQSPEARALGNETDNMLFFYANVATRLQAAVAGGRLSRPVTLAGISYFQTMQPPTNRSVVDALEATEYLHVHSPLERDWCGPLDANLADRDANRAFLSAFAEWQSFARLQYGVVDYQNLSVYGGLGLSDFPTFATNFEILTRDRRALYAYMHPLLRNQGPRRLTNLLLAKLAWTEPGAASTAAGDLAEAAIKGYFVRRYGVYADEWRSIHESMSRSVENAKEIFGTNSLYWLLLQEQLWSPPVYPRVEAVQFIARYRVGGVQDLPAASSGMPFIRASFRGLDESLRLQSDAAVRWSALLDQPLPPDVRQRMESDLVWFSTTASRYRLMAATSDFVLAREYGLDLEEPRERIAREIGFLRQSPVLSDTVSPVNQRLFLDFHAQLAGLP
jgi:hypothetical protein